MRNRAKCKLCNSIIESYHSEDYVSCKCDEISVYAGSAMRCAAKDFYNFLRIDDEGNEIVPTVTDALDINAQSIKERPTRKELIDMLQALIASIEALPTHAQTSPVTHYDLSAALILLSSILRAET